MGNKAIQLAIQLANQGYLAIGLYKPQVNDETPDYIAYNPDLYGCMAQGDTMAEAMANLETARIDYMAHLLDQNLPIPHPTPINGDMVVVDFDCIIWRHVD
jgi:predicted RNase H-like HicB family nuclease